MISVSYHNMTIRIIHEKFFLFFYLWPNDVIIIIGLVLMMVTVYYYEINYDIEYICKISNYNFVSMYTSNLGSLYTFSKSQLNQCPRKTSNIYLRYETVFDIYLMLIIFLLSFQ